MIDAREAFPSAVQAALLLLAHFLLQYVVGVAMYDLRGPMGLGLQQIQSLATLLATGIVLAGVQHHRNMAFGNLVHPSRSSAVSTTALVVPPVMLLVPAIVLADILLVQGLEVLFPLSRWEEQAFGQMKSGSFATVVSVCVLAPVLEEMLFRGVLLRSFLQQYPRWVAIAYSALFFGAAHLNVYQFVLAALLGVLLGWLFERSRSLIPCIALHAALNASVVALGLNTAGNEALWDSVSAGGIALAGAMALVGAVCLCKILARRMQHRVGAEQRSS
jgi:uncharacterized protein